MAASTGVALTGSEFLAQTAARASTALSPNGSNGIKHVVVLMMENRSFDHFLGWLPGADGRHDLTYLSTDGNYYPNYRWPPTSRAAGTATPTTAGRASWSSTTSARWTDSCSGPPPRLTTRG
jgi:Phospholipase C